MKLNCDKIMTNINGLRSMLQTRSNEINEAGAILYDIVESFREAGVFRIKLIKKTGMACRIFIQGKCISLLSQGSADYIRCYESQCSVYP